MKRFVIAIYLLAIHAVLATFLLMGTAPQRVAAAVGLSDPPPPPIIASMREGHRQMDSSVPAGGVIFLGDSITMALATAAVTPYGVNYGIGYQRTDDLIVSMRGYHSMARAGAVVIMIGTNDLLKGKAAGIEGRYMQILSAVPASIPVVFSSVPPNTRTLEAGVLDVRDSARRACKTRANCTFVDALSAMTPGGKIAPGVLLPDGVHLAPAGYAVWIDLLRTGLRESSH